MRKSKRQCSFLNSAKYTILINAKSITEIHDNIRHLANKDMIKFIFLIFKKLRD